MRQVIQNVRTGEVELRDAPDPAVLPGHLLIANHASVISAGTEKMVMKLARKSLLGKARERPDHVRRIFEKVRQEGLLSTTRKVFTKLDEPLPLGYSSCGVVLACGEGVQGFRPGDRVASNGSHADVVSVPVNLCALVPDGVDSSRAAFTVLGATALQGVRLAEVGLGSTVLVIGLGLVGQLAVALLKGSGCRVLATDPDGERCKRALRMGARVARPELAVSDVEQATRGLGADAVVVAAATESQEPMALAVNAVRRKGRVVLVGVVGLHLDRRPLYDKEAELVVSRSYGPGRYDPGYEERGRDYPADYVRWTVQRNMQAVVDLMESGSLDPEPLISHRFPFAGALDAYRLLGARGEPFMGVMLEYPDAAARVAVPRIELGGARVEGAIGVGCIGAGLFARDTLLPAIVKEPLFKPLLLCSAGGTHAAHAGQRFGFAAVTASEEDVYRDPDLQAVFLATPHQHHARQVIECLKAGKHVFVEKPLAMNLDEVRAIEKALAEGGLPAPLLMVGFNRRFAPASRFVKDFFAGVAAPKTVTIRFNAGSIPPEHWTQDSEIGGGRIVGEACHALDLATYLVGSPPARVYADTVGGPEAPRMTHDQCVIQVRHVNGGISSITYCAGGDRAFPKERIEMFGGGRVAVIDDFKTVTTVTSGRSRTRKSWQQDKGHRAEIAAFAAALKEGSGPPIPWSELRAVCLASLLAVRSIREGIPVDVP